MATDHIPLTRALEEEYVRLHGSPCGEVDAPSSGDDLKKLYARIHKDANAGRPRTALCISGGGIRSATFALGVLQELARRGILEGFDYLSTVSGGGYIGGWLSSYVRRRKGGIADVADELGKSASPAAAEAVPKAPLADPLQPEPDPIVNLRRYSNYLTPKLGLFSGDTWALAATYVRNLLLNWLMLLPILFAVLAVPRLLVALLYGISDEYVLHFGGIAFPLLTIAVFYLSYTRPARSKASKGWLYSNAGFQKLALLPFVLASILLVFLWGRVGKDFNEWSGEWQYVAIVFSTMSAIASLVYMLRYAWASRRERRSDVKPGSTTGKYVAKKLILEVLAALAAGLICTGLLYFFATQLFPDPIALANRVPAPSPKMWELYPPSLPQLTAELYACFGVPLVLFVLFAQSALFVGLSSWFNEDYDREWWARAAGWVLLAGVIWAAFAAIAIYGPVLIYEFPRIAAALGTVSGLISVIGGKSAKTSAADEKPGEKVDAKSAVNISLGVVASIFAVFLLALISLITSEILIDVTGKESLRSRNFPLLTQSEYKLTDPGTEVEHLNMRWRRTLEPPKYPALDLERYRSLRHLYVVDQTRWEEGVVLVFLLPLAGVIASIFIGVNQFSMHAMYRNRLIRAYLGASRGKGRQPNPFTGFDPNDNFSMHQLRAESFWMHSFQDLGRFIGELKKENDPLAKYIRDQLSVGTTRLLEEHANDPEAVAESLFTDLNRIIDEHHLTARTPAPGTFDSLRSLQNRQLINTHFAGLNPCTSGKPFHVVNATLNLVAGQDLAWQERKADSFTFSPLHSGNRRIGYRPSRVYGGPGGITLGTAVAISGAAASPNMGYNSSPALSFLLTLFNVRLGWWLGNPGTAGDDTYSLRNPKVSLRPLIDELTGSTDENHPYVYLSDGGHFENLALYEMVLRRCHMIVLTDAGADFSFGFNDLGNAVRKIRIDLGISITFQSMDIFPRSPEKPANAKYCAVGTIHYEDVDGAGAMPGTLLYIKPAVYFDKESRDIYNYARQNPQFPHESTADQFFSESQFESYRALGETTIKDICTVGNMTGETVQDLMKAAEEYASGKG